MTSEEFKKRFNGHPLGHAFQGMEVAQTEHALKSTVAMAEGMLLLLKFQDDITEPEYNFLREALQGNAQRNQKRIKTTNSPGNRTKQ